MVHTNLLVRDATVDDLKHTSEVVEIINTAYRSEGRKQRNTWIDHLARMLMLYNNSQLDF